ncbi:MAG: DUF1028 domain-containing protein [Phycisphaerae bacterium]
MKITSGGFTARLKSAAMTCVMLALTGALPNTAHATWSIVLIDTESKEIAVGSATCLTGFDLRQNLPVVLVDVGAACAQSAVDQSGGNRIRLREQLELGTDPEQILQILENFDSGHQSRQYGIVDVEGRAATFTGSQAGAHASGVVGMTGTIAYAIQGNVITGPPVVLDAAAAVIETPGDLPAKLMAAMEAARAAGGDGRCSCLLLNPTACGAPPPSFEKSAHIAFMVGTRTGDQDGGCNGSLGCATGDYFMNFNIANQSAMDEEPVFQLQDQFDQWRSDNIGKPDAVQSTVAFEKDVIRADSTETTQMLVTVRDWQGNVVTEPVTVDVFHDGESANAAGIIGTEMVAPGQFVVDLGLAPRSGLDKYRVRISGHGRDATLIPLPELLVVAFQDLDQDGETDAADYEFFLECLLGPDANASGECSLADFNFTTTVDLRDVGDFQNAFTGEVCDFLDLLGVPEGQNLCVGDTTVLKVHIDADPVPQIQWFKNGVAIPGADLPILGIIDAQAEDEGYYHVTIVNACGAIETEPVVIRVFDGDCPQP